MRGAGDVNPLKSMPEAPTTFDRERLQGYLPAGCVLGRSVQIFAETDSTNNLAREAGAAGAPEGLVFFAELQRAGRGRRGREWIAPAGSGLCLSVLLRPQMPRNLWPRLTMLCARAVIETLADVGVAASWKWPNDVVLGPGKLAGILVEAASRFAVLGIGLNVRQRAGDFPEELRARALSVEMITGRGIEREALAASLLGRLDQLYRSGWGGAGFADTLQFCVDRAALPPRRPVRVFCGDRWIEGTLLGYTGEGHLRLEQAGQEQVVHEGLLEEAGQGV